MSNAMVARLGRLSRLGAASALLLGFGMTLSAAAQDLTIVSWGGAFQSAQKEAFFGPYAAEKKINLHDEAWDGGIGLIRSRVAMADPGWDLVDVDVNEISLGCEEGLYVPIDWDRLGGQDNFHPSAVHECGVGAAMYNEGIAYDRSKLATAPEGWADFFDLEKFPGKRGVRLNPNAILTGALIADGVPREEITQVLSTQEGIDRALAKLDTIKSSLVFWKSGAQPPQLLASREVVMTTVYNGRIDDANRNDNRDFGFVWQDSLQQFDYWVILANARHVDTAYDFLAYINQPEVAARFPREIAYGVGAIGASEFVDADRLAQIPSSPENVAASIQTDVEFWLENNDRLSELLQAWAAK